MAARDKFKSNVWYDVPPKKNRNINQYQNCNDSSDGGIYIARKYDKLGKRFGFATFKVARNRVDLEERLKDVWIGSYKLFIVPARFVDGHKSSVDKGKNVDRTVRGEKVWKPVNEQTGHGNVDVQVGRDDMHINVNQSEGVEKRSFRDTLLNKKNGSHHS
ncbi:hypothetical protein Hanom_Chr01g00025951 [Helianthus anomalus]